MQKTYSYMIPGPPPTKKNSMQIVRAGKNGRPFIRQSKKYIDYETIASYFLSPKPHDPIDDPVRVSCTYYMDTRRRVDMTNLLAATHDVLVKFLVLADDNRDVIASVDGSRVYYDKENPRVEIRITPLEEEYAQWKEKK